MEIMGIYLYLRIFYAILILGIVIKVVVWSMKNGQFKKRSQEKASRLPLEIDEDNEEESL